MTTPEKCHQLTSRMPWSLVNADGSDAIGAEEVLRNPPGHIAQLIMDDPAQLAAMVGTIQRQVMSRSRLGIPALFHAEALSGFLAGGHMVFPSGTGLAAGWSPDLVERDGRPDPPADAPDRSVPCALPGPRRRPRPPLGPGARDLR